MRHMKLISALVITLQWMLLAMPAAAEETNTVKNCLKMHFAGSAGSKFALLVMGTENGEYTLDWGDGKATTGQLATTATTIYGELPSQDLTLYGNIAVLECSGNALTELDITGMPTLTHIISRENYVAEMDFSKCPELKMVCIQSSPLNKLDLSANAKIDSIIVTNNRIASLTLPEKSPLKYLSCTTNSPLTELNLTGCEELKYLDAMQTMVTKFDLSKNKKLEYVAAGLGKPITQFVLPEENKIDTLILPMANLMSIDLSQTKNLRYLQLDNNFMLSSLDLSGMTKLETLLCEGAPIDNLDLTDTRNLTMLTCNNNYMLTTLNLAGLSKLESVSCYSCSLSNLDMTGCEALKHLDCSENMELAEATFPQSLVSLNCSGCAFTKLDATKLPNLTDLHCNNNQIATLDMKALKNLLAIDCGDNAITSLDFSQNKLISDAVIKNNPITEGITFEGANDLRYVSVDGTNLGVEALNKLYMSLREKREGDDMNDVGGLLLFNNVANDLAKESATKIATDKGWMVSVEGTGTTSIGASPETATFSIRETADGLEASGISGDVAALSIYAADGSLVSIVPVVNSRASINIPDKGIYMIAGKGMKTMKYKK